MGENKYKFIVIFWALIGLFWLSAASQREVTLNSTLIHGYLALPGQRVIFTCVTKNSSILEWQSDEHVGTDGDDIQIYSVGNRVNVMSVTIPTTYATRVNVTMENGITVIVSRLFITASERFSTSSVTCRINGQGPIKTISFNTTARALQEVTLSSTLIDGHLAYPGQRITFTCVTRNSTILEWQSDEHIGTDGDDIQIYSIGNRENVTSVTIPMTYAIRVNVTEINGITEIVSQLIITTSNRFPISSVTCEINSLGPRQTISFNTTGFTLSPLGEVHMCMGEQLMLTCATNGQFLEWNITIPGRDYDRLRLISSSETRNIPSLTMNYTVFSFHRESREPLNITLTITNATLNMKIFCAEYHYNGSDSILLTIINVVFSDLVIAEPLFNENNASIGMFWKESSSYTLMVMPQATLTVTNGNATVMLSYNVLYNLTIFGLYYGCTSGVNLFYAKCDPPSPPTNGIINPYTSTQEGAMVNITCLHSKSQQQEKYTITCSHDGHWQPNLTDTCNDGNGPGSTSEDTSIIVSVIITIGVIGVIVLLVPIVITIVITVIFKLRTKSLQRRSEDIIPLQELET